MRVVVLAKRMKDLVHLLVANILAVVLKLVHRRRCLVNLHEVVLQTRAGVLVQRMRVVGR